ncbi:MAG: sensor domain-containing diguanylate cyclase [Kiritimatiellae bacterium]|jgi:diguanylate cyclase (GGDEF)-like protein|nr:sensor domain-containing diguanylate cyclase [Kiritimatiellia bacterium]
MTENTLGGWLVHVMREADGALSLEESLHVIMDSMKNFFPAQSVAILLIDDDTKELRIKISRQISYTFVKKFHKDGPSPKAEQVVLEQEPMMFNNIDPKSDLYKEIKLEHDFGSAVMAPIVMNQRGIGYVFCDRAEGETFGEHDLLHLQVLGYIIGNMIDKFDLIKASKKLSVVDDSTGALQYKAFIPSFATELQRAASHDYQVSLSLISIAAFRKYVEMYGIDAAHALLAEVAELIKQEIRDMDILARFGADEFILCFSGTTETEAQERLNKIFELIRSKAIGKGEGEIIVAIGAIQLETEKQLKLRVQDILAHLGKALVHAKSSIGNIEIEKLPENSASRF